MTDASSTSPANGTAALPRIPVICDQCRASAFAGDEPFAELGELLDFEPVPRKTRRVDGWTPALQRAFIASLAVTGSPARAARSIGKFAAGVEQLRKARGGNGFARAWDAAMELYRERELIRLKGHLAELADANGESSPSPFGGEGRDEGARPFPAGFDPDVDGDDRLEYLETQERIRERLLCARRLLLVSFAADPARRAAWETLCGPLDWDKAARGQADDGEAYAMRSALKAEFLLTAEAGLLPDMTGGRDGMEEIRQALTAAIRAHPEDFE